MRKLFKREGDGAVSDIVGTAVLLGVTVVIVAAATVAFSNSNNAQAAPPSLDVRANATADSASSGVLTLRHAGGGSMPAGALEAVVSTTTWSERVPIPDAFELDDTAYVPTTHAYSAGERLDVLLYAGSSLVGTASTSVAAPAGSAGPSPVFTALITDPAQAGESHAAGSTFHLSAVITHADGRRAVQSVFVDLSAIGGGATTPMYDDGAHGDDVAGDGNYSTHVFVPPGAAEGSATISVRATDIDGFSVPAAATLAVTVTSFGDGDPGDDGEPASDGEPGSQGPGGSNGVNGDPGGTLPPGSDPKPVITDTDPTSGEAGTVIHLTGTHLTNISMVTMAVEGANVIKYVVAYEVDPNAPTGTSLYVTVPNIPYEGDYIVNVTRVDTAFANSEEFTYTIPAPEITGFDPDEARAYEQVLVSGDHFTGAASVVLLNGTGVSFAVPWAYINDDTIAFITHPGLRAGDYDVLVTNTAGHSNALPATFTVLDPISPATLGLDPEVGGIGDVITVTGDNLGAVTRLTLRDPMDANDPDDDVIVDATWWYVDGELRFTIPVAAAPTATTPREWYVNLSAAYGNPVEVPEILTVEPVPAPTVSCPMSPVSGEPFTQVDIDGTNFVNLKSVYFESIAVVWAPVNETHLLAITHTGMVPNDYRVHVTTATGDAWSTCTFHADPLKLVPVYNKSVFSYVGVNVTVARSNGGDTANVTANVKLVDPTWSIVNTTTKTVQGTKTTYPSDFVPDQVSNSNTAAVEMINQLNCNAAGTNAVFVTSSGPVKLSQYDSTVFTMRFYLELTVLKGSSGDYETYRVVTNDVNQYFIVSPNNEITEVSDHAFPNGYWTCST